MDPDRFRRLLEAYSRDLTPRQFDVLARCAQMLGPCDQGSYVDLVVLAQTMADPAVRRRDVTDRVATLRHQPFGPLLVQL